MLAFKFCVHIRHIAVAAIAEIYDHTKLNNINLNGWLFFIFNALRLLFRSFQLQHYAAAQHHSNPRICSKIDEIEKLQHDFLVYRYLCCLGNVNEVVTKYKLYCSLDGTRFVNELLAMCFPRSIAMQLCLSL